MKIYTGVGSRQAPADILDMMELVAIGLRSRGWTLRSGHAPGSDQAFERGAETGAEVYLPWPGFEDAVPIVALRTLAAPSMAAHYMAMNRHENYGALTKGGRACIARNCHQVLGGDLGTPAKFVVAWTPAPFPSGGTGFTVRLAERNAIPIFNLANPEHVARMERAL